MRAVTKRITFPLIMFVLFFGFAGAADIKTDISLGVKMVAGRVDELVMAPGNHASDYISALYWELSPGWLLGFDAKTEIDNSFFFRLSSWFALPVKTGFMNDYDWYYTNRTEWTHWSKSEITSSSGFEVTAEIGYPVVKTLLERQRQISFSTDILLGYQFRMWEWRDVIVDSVYTSVSDFSEYAEGDPWRDAEGYVEPELCAIIYTVRYHLPYLGLRFVFQAETWEAGLAARLVPYPLVRDNDQHKLTETTFISASVGPSFCGFLSIFGKYSFSREVYIWIDLEGFYLAEFYGDTEIIEDQQSVSAPDIYKNAAGFSAWHFSVSLGFGVHSD